MKYSLVVFVLMFCLSGFAFAGDVTVTKSYADGVYSFDWVYSGVEPLQLVTFYGIGPDGSIFSSDSGFDVVDHGDGHFTYSIANGYDHSVSPYNDYRFDFETGAWNFGSYEAPVIDGAYINQMSLLSFGVDSEWNAIEPGNWNCGPGGSWEGMTPVLPSDLSVTAGLSWFSSSPVDSLYSASSPLPVGVGIGAILLGLTGIGVIFTGSRMIKKTFK